MAVACVALVCVANPAHASTLQFTGLGAHSIVTVNATADGRSLAGSFYAGELTWSWLDAVPEGFEPSFYTYCVDLFSDVAPEQLVDDPWLTTDSLVADVADAGGKVAWLINHFAAGIHATQSDSDAAALQAAIWEVLYDSTPDLATGNFQLVTDASAYTGQAVALAIANQANSYLKQLFGDPDGYRTASATFLDASPLGQDQVTRVPEPAILLLFGTGLLAVAGAGRRLRGSSSDRNNDKEEVE